MKYKKTPSGPLIGCYLGNLQDYPQVQNSERIQIKISNRKRYIRWDVGESKHRELPAVLSQWNYMNSAYFSHKQCMLSTREAQKALVSLVFVGRSVTVMAVFPPC